MSDVLPFPRVIKATGFPDLFRQLGMAEGSAAAIIEDAHGRAQDQLQELFGDMRDVFSGKADRDYDAMRDAQMVAGEEGADNDDVALLRLANEAAWQA